MLVGRTRYQRNGKKMIDTMNNDSTTGNGWYFFVDRIRGDAYP
jgi:hypothetical protein